MNIIHKARRNIKWLLTEAPVAYTEPKEEELPMYCDYCGDSTGGISNWVQGEFKSCQGCLKKVFDKVLKEDNQ